ncbi:MAG TPA: YaeQ family protein, partial [Polyangiaceae bacterium]|nr:YaeQ family protein [Polyangiaceae bacterium]
MALTATVHHLVITLSDVDRNVYEKLDIRVARHPSESARYFWQRTLAYCLSYEDGIAFSKGGLSDADEPPVSIHDPTGVFLAWIDVGSPSADRLHRASK